MGPVTADGDIADLSDSEGTIYKPTGQVEQHFGDRYYYNIPKAEETSSPQNIPAPPSDFTGRNAELEELEDKFNSGINIVGLRGIGGVGKTALALKLAERIKDRYPDGQIIVDMRGTTDPISPREAMGRVIHAYHPQEKVPDSEAEVLGMYRQALEGKKTLILLDNALDDKQLLSMIPPKSCGLIITSRRTIMIPGLYRKDLDVMKPEEAVALLINVCCSMTATIRFSKEDPAWQEIARLCGYLPLALRAAGSFLANTVDISPVGYAKELKDESTRLERIGEEGVERGVDASFSLSFQRLDSEMQQTFLNLSAFPADFDALAEEQICQDEGHKRLSELVRWSLVDYQLQGPDYGRYKLHDLARLFASSRQTESAKLTILERHSLYFKDLLSAADSLYKQGGDDIQSGLALFDREWANIRAGQAWAAGRMAQGISQESEPVFRLCTDYADKGAYVLDLRLHPRDKIQWLEAALDASTNLKDKAAESRHLGNLGLAYADLGETKKAIEYYEKAKKIAEEIGDIRNEGVWLGNLGIACKNLGETKKAIEYYEKALQISKEIGDRRGEGADLGNLGNAYADLGETKKAIEYYEKALQIDREIGDRRGEGNALFNTSLELDDLGKREEAVLLAEEALAIYEQIESPYAERVRQKLAEWRGVRRR